MHLSKITCYVIEFGGIGYISKASNYIKIWNLNANAALDSDTALYFKSFL